MVEQDAITISLNLKGDDTASCEDVTHTSGSSDLTLTRSETHARIYFTPTCIPTAVAPAE